MSVVPKCPRCNSDKIQKSGKYKGRQKFLCTACNRNFMEFYQKKELNNPQCVDCGGRTHKAGLCNGLQGYRCVECGRRFTCMHPKVKRRNVEQREIRLPSIESVVAVPCFGCPDLDRGCDVVKCHKMNGWIDGLVTPEAIEVMVVA